LTLNNADSDGERKGIRTRGTKGQASALLEWQILNTARHYTRLTVRQLYYILISKYEYTPSRKFYKVLDYHLTKMRRMNSDLHAKFVDPTRHFIPAPRPYHEIELWVEKDSIRNFLNNLGAKYRLSIQVLKGFASLSMYRRALIRAAERGVRKILYIGDFDPSGLLIEKVAEREMDSGRGIQVKRIALTFEQVKRFKPPSVPVNRKDSRARDYIAKYGERCWEVEAVRPRTLFRLVEEKLRESVPSEYLAEAEAREHAARIARPVAERMRRMMEREVYRLIEEGRSEEEIRRQLTSKYGHRRSRTEANRDMTPRLITKPPHARERPNTRRGLREH
jgi:hypothetical protein